MKHSLLILSATVGLVLSGQVLAHTGVRDVVLEKKASVAGQDGASWNAFTITHGCGGDSGQSYPVLGQSALFPFGDNAVWKDAAGTVIQVGSDGNGTIVPATGIGLNLAVAGVGGYESNFVTTEEIVDDLGRVRALLYKNGAMQPQLYNTTPFRVTVPEIKNNCVKSLKVRIGVINYCDVQKNEANDASGPYRTPRDAFGRFIPFLVDTASGDPQQNVNGSPVYVQQVQGNGDNNRADWWFPALSGGSQLYQDAQMLQATYWTTMTVRNSPEDIAACTAGGGTPVDVSVEPAGGDFDTYLTGANTQPFTKGPGPY